jgi:hypothetical protein
MELTMQQILAINEEQKKRARLANRLERVRDKLKNLSKEIDQEMQTKYTGWVVLLAHTEGKWVPLGCYNTNDADEIPDDLQWDLCLPIPDPTTVPEFDGF